MVNLEGKIDDLRNGLIDSGIDNSSVSLNGNNVQIVVDGVSESTSANIMAIVTSRVLGLYGVGDIVSDLTDRRLVVDYTPNRKEHTTSKYGAGGCSMPYALPTRD
jgi:hypothetical protein